MSVVRCAALDPVSPSRSGATRYTAWLDRWRNAIFVLALVVIVTGVALASRLSLHSDLSSLLPPSKQSVQDLEALRHRARSFGNVLVMLEAPTPEVRVHAAADLDRRLRALDPSLVATVSTDDNAGARYGWDHRFLFVKLADLRAANDALEARLKEARLEPNPFFVQLDDPDPKSPTAAQTHLDDLQRQLDDAERDAAKPAMRLSHDGRSQLFSLTVTFPSSDVPKGRIVMNRIHAMVLDLEQAYPGVKLELAGSINISIFEHDSVIAGMALAAAITIAFVVMALLVYYRSLLPVLGALFALLVGVTFTLGFTYVAIGHLNLLSAFLTAIVVGNGINPGLIILARFSDEIREGHAADAALAKALRGSLHGTLAASLTAAVAYGALIVTDFRGFRHFGIIGGVGMLACWVTAYTVFPVALNWLARKGLIRSRRPPAVGELLARLAPKSSGPVLVFGGVLTAIAFVITAQYLIKDPFEKDWRDLQADGAQIRAQHEVDARMTDRFARDKVLSGHSYQLVVAVNKREQVAGVVAALRASEAKRPPGQELFADIKSIADLVPPDQDAKLALLAEIHAKFQDPALAQLDDAERAKLERLDPPADLRPITDMDIPPDLARLFVEQDGSVGRLIYVKGSPRFKTWNVDDRIVFADEIRRLELPAKVVIGGEPLVIADIVATMERDAPLMIIAAILGSILAVWLVVRLRRHGMITLICGLAGVLVMIAACALAGLRVHFLDLIALPITIGIGVDYAVNLVARDREDAGPTDPRRLLATTGGAVLLCSFTTTVGYGSLLLSTNGGVRAFGLAAIIGEVSCIFMALVLAPALLVRWRER